MDGPLIQAEEMIYFNPRKCYVVIGGLGEVSLELANWLIIRGARRLVLTSRTGVKNGYQSRVIKDWRDQGVVISIIKNDVLILENARLLIKEALLLGPIGGIFNMAVVSLLFSVSAYGYYHAYSIYSYLNFYTSNFIVVSPAVGFLKY